MKIFLTYFKPSGKFYTEGAYETKKTQMLEICTEVREMLDRKELPGLIKGHSDFIIHINTPELYPALIIK